MVTISSYHVRQTQEGKSFVVLELLGDVEMIQSMFNGKFYATCKKCTISSTFNEDIAKSLIGKQLPGRIDRIEVEAYEYTVKETGEVQTLTHSYIYVPEEEKLVTPEAQPQKEASKAA